MAAPRTEPAAPQLPPQLDPVGDEPLEDDHEWEQALVTGDYRDQCAEDVVVTESRFAGALFTGCELERLHLSDTLIEDCDLSGARLEQARLRRVRFVRCRVSGLVLSRSELHDVVFEDCRADGASFRMSTAERLAFVDCNLRDADLYEARLPAATFRSCDLQGAELSGASLPGARMQGSTLDGVKGGLALAGARIDSRQIVPVALAMFGALGVTIDDDDLDLAGEERPRG